MSFYKNKPRLGARPARRLPFFSVAIVLVLSLIEGCKDREGGSVALAEDSPPIANAPTIPLPSFNCTIADASVMPHSEETVHVRAGDDPTPRFYPKQKVQLLLASYDGQLILSLLDPSAPGTDRLLASSRTDESSKNLILTLRNWKLTVTCTRE